MDAIYFGDGFFLVKHDSGAIAAIVSERGRVHWAEALSSAAYPIDDIYEACRQASKVSTVARMAYGEFQSRSVDEHVWLHTDSMGNLIVKTYFTEPYTHIWSGDGWYRWDSDGVYRKFDNFLLSKSRFR